MPAPIGAKRKQKLLDVLATGKSITAACRAAKIGKSTVKEWRQEGHVRYDAEIAAAIDEAIDSGTDTLEDIAQDRAENGSDVLTIFLLKGRRPAKYRDNVKVENTGPGGGPQKVEVTLTDDDARAAYHALIDAGLVQPGPAALADPED